MEHFFKAQVFLRRSGFRQIETEQGKNPPTTDEVKEMADYLGVDIKVGALGNGCVCSPQCAQF
jgi:hypothetical protein